MTSNVPWIAENCGRCGRPLKTDQSRENGFGPVCLKKHNTDMARAQMSIEEFEQYTNKNNG